MTRSLFRGRESNSDSWGLRGCARVSRDIGGCALTTRVLAAPAEQHYGRVTLATRKTEWRVHPDIPDARANLGEEARSREIRASVKLGLRPRIDVVQSVASRRYHHFCCE